MAGERLMIYTKEYLDTICEHQHVVIVETTFGETLVGYFVKASWSSKYKVLPLDINADRWCLTRSQIKRIINLNGYVHPKNPDHKRYTMLNLYQLQDLLDKAGYTFQ